MINTSHRQIPNNMVCNMVRINFFRVSASIKYSITLIASMRESMTPLASVCSSTVQCNAITTIEIRLNLAKSGLKKAKTTRA
ncbi:hypothetical protein LFREDSHE_43640 [Shewanella baltica]